MIDHFNNIYSSIKNKNSFLTKIRFYSLLRVTVRQTANIVLPIYFNLTAKNSKYRLKNNESESPKLIVSFTSFPARINKVWLVVETILRQTQKPDKIILWLSKEQFSDIDKLPKKLLNLRERGLQIEIKEEDLRSHKKYYYAVKEYPNDYIITIDDDVFYSSNTIFNLVELEKKYLGSITVNHGKRITFENGCLMPYIKWDVPSGEITPSHDLMQIGIGGVLYPPNSLHPLVLRKDIFMEHIKYADDIWLYLMASYNKTKICKTKTNLTVSPVINRNNVTLTKINVGENLNDKQLKNMREYFIKHHNIDLLKKSAE